MLRRILPIRKRRVFHDSSATYLRARQYIVLVNPRSYFELSHAFWNSASRSSLRSSIHYNTTDAGLDVVFHLFDLLSRFIYRICLHNNPVCAPTPGVFRTQMNVQVKVTVNTSPVNKSQTTSSPVSVLQFIDDEDV